MPVNFSSSEPAESSPFSSSYAMDDTFLTVDEAIEFVGDFVEEKSAVTEKMSYGIWNHEGTIYFTVTEIL